MYNIIYDYQIKIVLIRELSKSLINTQANMYSDKKKETLTVKLYPLSNNRDNRAAIEMCKLLNNAETIFPVTNLRLIYKFTT